MGIPLRICMWQFCSALVLLLLFAIPYTSAESCAARGIKEDCGYLGIGQQECEARSCCWQPTESGPWCFWPQDTADHVYTVTDRQDAGGRHQLSLQRQGAAVLPEFGPDFDHLDVLLEAQTASRLHVVIRPTPASSPASSSAAQHSHGASGTADAGGQIGATPRWEVPEWLLPRPPHQGCDPAACLYYLQLPQPGQAWGLTVMRRETDAASTPRDDSSSAHVPAAVFDSTGTRLVYKDQYLELTTKLQPSAALYGLGETINPSGSLVLPRDGRSITLWNYDVAAFNPGVNLYGSHPFVLSVQEDGSASGLFLLNSNGMDVELQETSMTFKVIGGVLELYILLGPGPEAVIQQYHDIIGPPAMPPYWALGFHQCRWGYHDLAEVERVVDGYSVAGIPLEVMWTDIDYMYKYRDFTFDPERFDPSAMRAFVDGLHARGQRWVPITDCGIPHAPDDPAFTSGLAQGVFLKDITGQPYLGQVWPGATHYPDFLAVNVTWPWWRDQLLHMWQQVPFDGMWIDMNEASNFCEGEVCRLPGAAAPTDAAGASTAPGAGSAGAGDAAAGPLNAAAGKAAGTGTAAAGDAAPPRPHHVSGLDADALKHSQQHASWALRALRAVSRAAVQGLARLLGHTGVLQLLQHHPTSHSHGPQPAPHPPSTSQAVDTSTTAHVIDTSTTAQTIDRSTAAQAVDTSTTAHVNCELACSPPSADNKLAHPPYAINNLGNRVPLGSKTLPMTARHVDGAVQYDTHNLYGVSEAAATSWALQQITGKRAFVLSRSTFPGSGRHTAHWTGDNAATWQDLVWSVPGLINSNMWGLAMAGADICGFSGDTTEELCARWIAAGAFYTFTRNHNTLGAAPQELYIWPSVAAAAREALSLRYRLLPYLYTCLYQAHVEGGTVARPLFFEFPGDPVARSMSTQWLWGSSLLIAPVLQQGVTEVQAYLPDATWYSLADYSRHTGPCHVTIAAPLTNSAPVFLRGGSIVPTQQPGNTTDAVRQSPVTLLVGLDRRARAVPLEGGPAQPQTQAAGAQEQQQQVQQEVQEPHEGFLDRSAASDVTDSSPESLDRGSHGQEGVQGAAAAAAAAAAAGGGRCGALQASLARHLACGAASTAAAGGGGGGCLSAEDSGTDGLLLGCGRMYWDVGDSLLVPPDGDGGGSGSVSVLFASIATPDTHRGWLLMAAGGADQGADGVATGAGGMASRESGFGVHMGAAADTAAAAAAAGDGQQLPVGGRGMAGGAPAVAQVHVVGVEPPAAGAGGFVVWLDGVQLLPHQVEFVPDTQLLKVSGLNVQLGVAALLEWRVTGPEGLDDAADAGIAAV